MLAHLKEFIEDRRKRGRDELYVYHLDRRLQKLLNACGWIFPADVTADSYSCWRNDQKLAAKTLNDYLDAMIGLLRWMGQRGRLVACPLTKDQLRIDGRELEKVVRRRAWSDDEASRLLAFAGKHRDGSYKPALLAAIITGLRRGELKKLRWGDLHLSAIDDKGRPRPFLTARATTTKNGKLAQILIRDDLLAELERIKPAVACESERVFEYVPDMRTIRALDGKARH